MDNQQFKQFLKHLDVILDQKFLVFEEKITNKLERRFRDIEGKIDWIIGAIDTDEKERLALGFNFDRKFNDHEHRIKKLELAT
ncbi:hypothetical protein FWF89_00350 [Candidatus Saccharibacteria bacterium]|nr:hypothetical protein [Candidatus Saccharibacteria bacterium]